MKKYFYLLFLLCGFSFSQTLKSPSAFLGYELGSTFTAHHKVVDYFTYIAKNSPLVVLQPYGFTEEGRLLQIAYISSTSNINNLENIRQNHLKSLGVVAGGSESDFSIVWLSYNVHGNEASSTEAAMKTIYHLITEKTGWLENTLVIIDPCINPDGRDRYVHWYKQVKSNPYDSYALSREHKEPWPGGRSNHYLFDLNRDWAWAKQIETQQRLKVYQKWLPHIHVDFHEQGINSPYYFAPAAEPLHEIITDFQRDFQTLIGKNHAKYFDREGWLYFTKERFDLLYPSYGDTYPTYMGAIGMTYEQAGHGKAGLGIKNDEKTLLTLADRINHHFTTGISTVEVGHRHRKKLAAEQKKFFNNTSQTSNYILTGDFYKIKKLTALLDLHNIAYGFSIGKKSVKGFHYTTQRFITKTILPNTLVIKENQPNGKMVKVLFENKTHLSDSLTYDITAWTLPFAYGLDGIITTTDIKTKPNKDIKKKNTIVSNSYAYAIEWKGLNSAKMLSELLKKNINVRFTKTPITQSNAYFDRGSLFILKGENKNIDSMTTILSRLAKENDINISSLSSGFSDKGADLGSDKLAFISPPKIGLVSSEKTSSLNYGELWYFFEKELKYPIHQVRASVLYNDDINNFTTVILPSGNYKNLISKEKGTPFMKWLKNGGKVIVFGSAVKNFADKKPFQLKLKKENEKDKKTDPLLPYAQKERAKISEFITGSIFKTTLDITHPLAFGYDKYYYTLKMGKDAYNYLENGNNVAYLTKTPKSINGFSGSKALKKQKESLIFGTEPIGKGQIIYFIDNPLFRAFWENGKLWVANAVFF